MFSKKPYEDRYKMIREARVCGNCFKPGHIAKGCLHRSACEVRGCTMKHRTLLHPPALPKKEEKEKVDKPIASANSNTPPGPVRGQEQRPAKQIMTKDGAVQLILEENKCDSGSPQLR